MNLRAYNVLIGRRYSWTYHRGTCTPAQHSIALYLPTRTCPVFHTGPRFYCFDLFDSGICFVGTYGPRYPDYYVVIKRPIALREIQQRIRDKKYPDLTSFCAAFKLLFDNARTTLVVGVM